MHFALTSAAVHCCWVTAPLYEQHISKGATELTQACCESVSQSSAEQRGIHCALTSAAVHFCWVTAPLYEEQISIVAIAVIQCLP